ncbi:MAG: T9SS type A sorting domain-containing protein [Bacteroidota bacterium]
MKIIPVLLLFWIPLSVQAQSGYELQWSTPIDGPSVPLYGNGCSVVSPAECQQIRLLEDSILLVGGSTAQTLQFARLNLEGDTLWHRPWDLLNDRDDYVIDLQLNEQEEIILLANSEKMGFETDTASIFLMAADLQGQMLWQSSFQLKPNTLAFSMAIDPNNGIYVAGITQEGYDFRQTFITKFDQTGEELWTYLYEPSLDGYVRGLDLEFIDGELVFLGSLNVSSEYKRMVLIRLDPEGNLLQTTETPHDDIGSSGLIDRNGNLYLGVFGNFNLYKYAPNGDLLWQRGLASNLPSNVNADEVQAIQTDEEGNVFFTGRHYGLGYPGPENYTNGDLVVLKTDSEGELLYSYRYEHLGSNSFEGGNWLDVADNGYLLVGGRSALANLGDPYQFLSIVLRADGTAIDTLRNGSGGDYVIRSVVFGEDYDFFQVGLGSGKTVVQRYQFLGDPLLSISDLQHRPTQVRCFPNPSQGIVHFEWDKNIGQGQVVITDMLGRVVSNTRLVNRTSFRWQATQPGWYLYQIIDKTGKQSQGKLLIKP